MGFINTGESCWMSVDEGDIAMEQALELNDAAPAFESLDIGSTVDVGGQSLHVTEKNFASCLGFGGELPEVIGWEKHAYVHLLGANSLLVTVEYSDEGTESSRATGSTRSRLRHYGEMAGQVRSSTAHNVARR